MTQLKAVSPGTKKQNTVQVTNGLLLPELFDRNLLAKNGFMILSVTVGAYTTEKNINEKPIPIKFKGKANFIPGGSMPNKRREQCMLGPKTFKANTFDIIEGIAAMKLNVPWRIDKCLLQNRKGDLIDLKRIVDPLTRKSKMVVIKINDKSHEEMTMAEITGYVEKLFEGACHYTPTKIITGMTCSSAKRKKKR